MSQRTPLSSATRRQLLEYAFVFDVQGVLFFDMERRRIQAVRFAPAQGARTRGRAWSRGLAAGVAIALTAGALERGWGLLSTMLEMLR